MTRATQQPCPLFHCTQQLVQTFTPTRASNATFYPLILSRWSCLLLQRKNRGYRDGPTQLPTPPPRLLPLPHTLICTQPFHLPLVSEQKLANVSTCILAAQSLEPPPGPDLSVTPLLNLQTLPPTPLPLSPPATAGSSPPASNPVLCSNRYPHTPYCPWLHLSILH